MCDFVRSARCAEVFLRGLDLIRAARDVVALEHRCCLVAADGHGQQLRHSSPDHVPNCGASEIVNSLRPAFAFLRRRAQRDGIADGRSGAVAVIQRFGGALNLNVHIHALVMDWP